MRVRAIISGLATGLLFVGSGWAGVGLAPVDDEAPVTTDQLTGDMLANDDADPVPSPCGDLGANELCAGASAISLYPTPDATAGEVWEQDPDKCEPLSPETPEAALEWATDTRLPWVENANCIYMGGYGLGPSNPVVDWDQTYDLWARSFAYSRGGQTLILTLLDAEGYFAEYARLCGGTCGSRALAEEIGAELGISPESFIVASTHSHTSLDLIGGWGAVPEWYMHQVADAIRDSQREAYNTMVPATVEAGEVLAREFNSERRDTYRSGEDPTLNFIRAIDAEGGTVSTVGTFASHPVSADEGTGIGNADFPAVFSARAEQRFGGVAAIFQAGLGNMSPRPGHVRNHEENWIDQGEGLANALPEVGKGTPVPSPDVKVSRAIWDQPVTNIPLGLLGAGSFFDRPFGGPAVVTAGKSGNKPCVSASAVSVAVSVTAAKIGQVVVTAAPGEVFANFTNTIEERSPITALAMGQANDALGYMPQEFESDITAQQATGFIGEGVFEYEDAYMIDRCFGDVSLETTLGLLGSL